MTYFPTTNIKIADSPSADAFGNLRISQPITLFDNKQVFSSSLDTVWSESGSNGASTFWSGSRASTFLSVSNSAGSRMIRQTKQRMHYQPGKSLDFNGTFVFGNHQSNILRRGGLFDDNDGIFLEQSGSDVNLVVRSGVSGANNIIENRVSQSQWNLDKLDGTGKSGITLDLSKAQIFSIDFQWLGVGRVRCGFNMNGITHTVHQFNHANINDSVYMSNPNLPARYEILNDGGGEGAVLEQICVAVKSEGGFEPRGILRSADRDVHPISISSGVLGPVLSIRLNPANPSSNIIPRDISVLSTTNAAFRWVVLYNPTIAGSDNANWQSIENSSVQYDVSRTDANALSGGTQLASGYVEAGGNQSSSPSISNEFRPNLALGTRVDGTTDELIIAAETIGASGAESYLAKIEWQELD